MADKRIEVTQEMCRQVQLLIKGGATNKEAGRFVGVSASTVSRIRTANYDAVKYQQHTEARRAAESGMRLVPDVFTKEVAENMPVPTYKDDGSGKAELTLDQVPGQIKMLFPGEGKEPQVLVDENKMMRFLAAKIGEVTTKLDKINDTISQILRRLDR